MLAQKIYIYQPASLGSGKYEADIYFQNSTVPQYVNLGDYIRDTAGNSYEIITPTTIPVGNGNTVTVQYISEDVLPVEDSDYNSDIYTPGQIDVRPKRQTAGSLGTSTIYSAINYEYEVLAGWLNSIVAANAQVGDSIVDASGKEFKLTYIDPTDRFLAPCRIQEIHKEIRPPVVGDATLYSPTENFGYFQGTEMQDPPRNVVQNRDRFFYDRKFKELQDSIGPSSGVEAVEGSFLNNTGGSLDALTPVRHNSQGNMANINTSIEAEAMNFLGLLKATTSDSEMGDVVKVGLIKNVTTSFSIGDLLFVSKIGGLTSTPPEIDSEDFAAGDFVLYVGQVTKNSTNSEQKDIFVDAQVLGQL